MKYKILVATSVSDLDLRSPAPTAAIHDISLCPKRYLHHYSSRLARMDSSCVRLIHLSAIHRYQVVVHHLLRHHLPRPIMRTSIVSERISMMCLLPISESSDAPLTRKINLAENARSIHLFNSNHPVEQHRRAILMHHYRCIVFNSIKQL